MGMGLTPERTSNNTHKPPQPDGREQQPLDKSQRQLQSRVWRRGVRTSGKMTRWSWRWKDDHEDENDNNGDDHDEVFWYLLS